MRKNFRSTRRAAPVSTKFHPVITVEQAKKDGLSKSQVLTISRSLERIARKGYEFHDGEDDVMIEAYDRQQAFHSARALREVAKHL